MMRITLLKVLQLAASVGVLVLVWLVYPGVMMLFATAIGICYMIASIGALRDNRIAIPVALVFSILTAVLSSSGVYLFLKNDFDFLAGRFDTGSQGFYLPPYLFLLVAVTSVAVVVLHFVTWPWMIRPRATGAAEE